MSDLSAAGLSETEAKTYKMLLSEKNWLPSTLAIAVNETRTNIYKILDKLTTLGLAERLETYKKLRYRASNPTQLLELTRQQRQIRDVAEKQLELDTQSLITEYIQVHEQPGISYFQGLTQIRHIFEAIANAKSEVLFVHTRAGDDYYGTSAMHNLRMLAVNNGVQRRALTPDNDIATSDYLAFDPTVLLKRTWLREHEDYASPVEWGVYDDKLYIISYGTEALGIIIQSQPIADAFAQLFTIMERGQRSHDWYDKLPKRAKVPGINTPLLAE